MIAIMFTVLSYVVFTTTLRSTIIISQLVDEETETQRG